MSIDSQQPPPPPADAKPPPRRGAGPPAAVAPPLARTKAPPAKTNRCQESDQPLEDELDDVEELDEVEEFDEADNEPTDDPTDDPSDDPSDGPAAEHAESGERRRLLGRGLLYGASAWMLSMIVNTAILMTFALWLMPGNIKSDLREIVSSIIEERSEDDLMKVELDEQIHPATQVSAAVTSSAPEVGVAEGAVGGPAGGGSIGSPTLDSTMLDQLAESTSSLSIGLPLDDAPPSRKLITAVPQGFIGDPRTVVDNYQEAMDRITQEIMWMLSKGKVLVVWSFDQSESMKDDQKEIRDRVERVYLELGLVKKSDDPSLLTSVTSFGADFMVHTKRPTSDLFEIRVAIDQVPLEPSGKEMMTQAVGKAILYHGETARRQERQMALILVTDESGDQATNVQFLEQAITEAKETGCRIYVLGREAVFGYPYAHIRWVHPQTGGVHWLPIDRGPETAFVEQLQTDGFHRRYDAHPSGFGPYEQARMAQQTGGIFFLLPSLETNLVRGEKRRYELEQMRAYVPDLRGRTEVIFDRDQSRLRTSIWKVINDLNPYRPEISRIIEMRMTFSNDSTDFRKQALIEQAKALEYLRYLALAESEMNVLRHQRQQEVSPRWQANYDLIYAQIIAYQARIYEYGAYLEYFLRNPTITPPPKPPTYIAHWNISGRKELIHEEKSLPYINKAKLLFQEIITEHAGTPWSARAQMELARGFGVHLLPAYHTPSKPSVSRVPSAPVPIMPIPKL